MSFITSNTKKGFTDRGLNKLGNTIIYLTDKIPFLSKTQCLKLLYLLDEFSIKKYGLPFLGLKYEVWQYGPVSQDVFVDLSDQPQMLSEYINIEIEYVEAFGNNTVTITKLKDFCDDEFSDNDINMLEYVVDKFGDKTAKELSDITHKPNSLWYNMAKENGLLELFEKRKKTSSNCMIDFSLLLDEEKKEIYNSYIEHKNLERYYS